MGAPAVPCACLAATAATALALLLAGCGDAGRSAVPPTGMGPASSASPSAPPTAASPASSVDASCGASTAGGRTVRFGAGTATNLVGVLLGTGRTGLVFAHGSQGNRCKWASYAQESVKAGYRALIFDFAGHGESTDSTDGIDEQVRAAVGYLRSQGVQQVVLVGASMGGTAVLAAAAQISPPVAGVISLSGPWRYRGVNAGSAVTRLAVPVLYAVCQGESDFAEDAASLYASTPPAVSRRLLVVPDCSTHGVELLDPGAGPAAVAVRAAVHEFLAANAPV
jgi:pimeloyl-ACP methyl ester carboxylesterase